MFAMVSSTHVHLQTGLTGNHVLLDRWGMALGTSHDSIAQQGAHITAQHVSKGDWLKNRGEICQVEGCAEDR